jgi:hypothetical protein
MTSTSRYGGRAFPLRSVAVACDDCGLRADPGGHVPIDAYRQRDGTRKLLCLGDLATRRGKGERWRRFKR